MKYTRLLPGIIAGHVIARGLLIHSMDESQESVILKSIAKYFTKFVIES